VNLLAKFIHISPRELKSLSMLDLSKRIHTALVEKHIEAATFNRWSSHLNVETLDKIKDLHEGLWKIQASIGFTNLTPAHKAALIKHRRTIAACFNEITTFCTTYGKLKSS
jgi:hypothetical protein